jgi:hypothetical protein
MTTEDLTMPNVGDIVSVPVFGGNWVERVVCGVRGDYVLVLDVVNFQKLKEGNPCPLAISYNVSRVRVVSEQGTTRISRGYGEAYRQPDSSASRQSS